MELRRADLTESEASLVNLAEALISAEFALIAERRRSAERHSASDAPVHTA